LGGRARVCASHIVVIKGEQMSIVDRAQIWLIRASLVAALAAVAALLPAVPAFAAEPPLFPSGVEVKEIHPTRAEPFIPQATVPGGERTYMDECGIEYAQSESGPFTLADHDVVSAEKTVNCYSRAHLSHLVPETTYYVRFFATTLNGGSTTAMRTFTTPGPAAPEFTIGEGSKIVLAKEALEKAAASASFETALATNAAETTYGFEYATDEAGPYTPFTVGATGKVAGSEEFASPEASLTGLSPATTYYIRVVAENAHGHVSETRTFTTPSDKPTSAATELSRVKPTSAVLQGRLKADGFGVQWHLEYAVGAEGPWIPVGEGAVSEAEVEADEAREAQVVVGPVEVQGLSSATTYYARLVVENEHGTSSGRVESFKTPGPPVVATFATHALEGEATMRVLGQVRSGFTGGQGEGYEARYHLEYVGQRQFEASGWSGAASTPEAVLEEHGGEAVDVVSEELTGLTPGETYHYRFVASNTTAGDPVVEGDEATLAVPTPAAGEAQSACPNEAFRVGPSAQLPDCRAYEQVTPVEKGGTQNAFNYTASGSVGYLVGADGESLYLRDPGVKWGSSPDPVNDDYFFSRTPSGWRMTSAKPVGEPGPSKLEAEVFDPDLTGVGLSEGWDTAAGIESSDVEFRAGPPGGPYLLVASVPSADKSELVGESADGGKYVLSSADHELAGRATGSTAGEDLYEFFEGKLRQMNVMGGSPGTPISACGAQMPTYEENGGTGGAGSRTRNVENAVSADGSRVFFTDDCTHHLYMRVNGSETVDIGAYTLLAANAEGTALALEDAAGEVLGYDTEAGKTMAPSAAERAAESELIALGIPVRRTPEANDPFAYARYAYFVGNVAGLVQRSVPDEQVYRYDSVEHVVECVSCASSFDPNPAFRAFFNGDNDLTYNNGNSENTFGLNDLGEAANVPLSSLGGSANGDFVFFDTISALLPRDVDGELPSPCAGAGEGADCIQDGFSPSSDVYEWRGDGVDGCTQVLGCVSLITTGKGGFLNEFLGTDASGRDVFFATDESLVATDQDIASDIYDARIDGGFAAPPPRPAECEGDSCSAPPSAPNDLTPASATFQGAGDLPGAMPEAKPTQKQKKKTKRKRKKGSRAKSGGRKAGRGAHAKRAVHRVHGGVR
jgi:phosphodiesterase/alkaline phosphatase D-like protein